MIEGELRDLLAYIVRRPKRPPRFMALSLKQDPVALQVRLDVAERLGWLDAEAACCGKGWRYSATDAGRNLIAYSDSRGSPGR